jgi:hypothetical protein
VAISLISALLIVCGAGRACTRSAFTARLTCADCAARGVSGDIFAHTPATTVATARYPRRDMRVTETSDSRFDVQGPLGSGGMGTVYRAYDPRLGRDIALKMLRTVTGRDLYRFKREFRSLADIVHPNLVSLHELHTTGGQWFFTMELVEGVTFATWVRPDRGPLDEDRLRAALPQLVEGVLALHVGGKLHRDLKPSNVLVTRDGRVVLLDFGLVSDVIAGAAERTHEATAVGTPAYMSPEQAADLPLTEASDWYSVGVMLYEALTGKRPFEGAPEALMRRKQVEVPASPRDLDPAAPEDLARLCLALLARDPAARPDGKAILETLGQAPSAALITLERVAVARPFIGRGAELEALRAAFADARSRTVAVYVHGESGIGKSQLVRHLLDEVAGEATVLEGRCYERESVPYKTLDTVVDAVTGVLLGLPEERARAAIPPDVAALARLFPVLKRVPVVAEKSVVAVLPPAGPELRARAFAALRGLLARLAADAPVVIAIDDLQWGDLDSAVFLGELVHLPDPVPLLLVLVHRPEDDGGVVARVRAELPGLGAGDQREVAVGPLPDDEARQLLLAVGAGSAAREAVIREAGGHPLFLAELARTVRHRGADSATLEELIGRRIAALPESAASLLRAAAVAARPVPFDLAMTAAGLSRVGTELQLLRAERLLRVRHLPDARGGDADVEHIEPYHDRIRQAAVSSTGAKHLRAMHEALARAYEARGTGSDKEILVAHWLAAGQLVRASDYAAEAAVAAEAALAFHRAAQLYSLAIEHGVHDAPARRALHRKRGDALASAGRLMEAAAEYAAAARGASDDDAMELDRLRVEALLRHGAMDEGLALSRRLLAQIDVSLPETRPATIRAIVRQLVRARLRGLRWTERAEADVPPDVLRRVDLLFTASSSVPYIDPVLGRLCQSHFLRAALDCGEPRRVCLALALELAYLGQHGPRAQRKIDRVTALVRPLAARVDSHYARGVAACMEGYVNFMLGRWSEARALLEDGLRTLREHGSGGRWEMNVCDQVLLTVLFYLGDAREAGRLLPRLVREAMERGDSYAQDGLRAWRGHPSWLLMGRLEDARAHVLAVEDASPAPGTIQVRHLHELIARVNIALYEGDGAAAQAHLDAGWPAIAASGLLRVQILRIESGLVRGRAGLAAGAAGDEVQRRAAATLGRGLARELEREGGWAVPIGKLLRGGAAALLGERDAAAILEDAERGFTAHHMALLADVARLRRSQLEGGTAGSARAAAARESMRERGVADVDAVSRMLCPLPA